MIYVMYIHYLLLLLYQTLSVSSCPNNPCFTSPPECTGSSCIVQFENSDYGSAFNVSMTAQVSYFSLDSSENFWLGMGLSEQGSMGDSQITLCTKSSGKTSVIQVKGYSHGVLPTSIGPSLTSQVSLSKNEMVISCNFLLHKSFFDGENRHLFIGAGPVEDNYILYHHSTPLISEGPVNLFSEADSDLPYASVIDFRILLHASAMITGYGIFLVVGIYTSRYLKAIFGSAWYKIHTSIMYGMVIIVAVGFGSILLKVRTINAGVHELVGFLIICLTIFQIILGGCRPYKKHSARNSTTFLHLFIGCFLLILIVINIFLGLSKIQSKIPNHIFVIQGIYVIWIVFGSILGNEVLKHLYGNDHNVYVKKLKLYTMINIGVILMYGCTIIILLNVVD